MEHLKFLTKYAEPHVHYEPEPLLKNALDSANSSQEVNWVFRHPGMNSNVIQHAIDKNIPDLTEKALRSQHVTSDQIHAALKSDNPNTRANAVRYNAGPEHLEKAVNDKSSEVRMAAALNPNATDEQLHKLVRDPDLFVNMNVALNTGLKKEHIDQLVNHPNSKVRLALCQNINLKKEHWDRLENDRNYEVAEMAKYMNPSKED